MIAEDVLAFYFELESMGIRIWIDGGWCVDALLGRITRSHSDLDIVIEMKDVDRTLELLHSEGYKEVRRDTEWNYVMGDDRGREIDFHIVVFDTDKHVIEGIKYPDGSLDGNGTIEGHAVRCIALKHLIDFHTGYPLRESDFADMSALSDKFGVDLPAEYAGFKQIKE